MYIDSCLSNQSLSEDSKDVLTRAHIQAGVVDSPGDDRISQFDGFLSINDDTVSHNSNDSSESDDTDTDIMAGEIDANAKLMEHVERVSRVRPQG